MKTLSLFTKEADLALRSPKRPRDPRRLAQDRLIAGLRRASKKKLVYLICPFHLEKTPSCVIYRKGINGSRWDHFHCYGCHKTGSLRELFSAIRNPPPPVHWNPFNPFTKDPI